MEVGVLHPVVEVVADEMTYMESVFIINIIIIFIIITIRKIIFFKRGK